MLVLILSIASFAKRFTLLAIFLFLVACGQQNNPTAALKTETETETETRTFSIQLQGMTIENNKGEKILLKGEYINNNSLIYIP